MRIRQITACPVELPVIYKFEDFLIKMPLCKVAFLFIIFQCFDLIFSNMHYGCTQLNVPATTLESSLV